MATSSKGTLKGVLGILREALRVPARNGSLTASVLLLVLLPWPLLMTVPGLNPSLSLDITPLVGRFLPLPPQPSNGDRQSPPGMVEPGAPPASAPSSQQFTIAVGPVSYGVTALSTLAMVYLSAVACKGKHSTLSAWLSKIRRSWKMVAVSFLYTEIIQITSALLFLVVVAPVAALKKPTLLVVLLVLLATFSGFCVTILAYLYLAIACQVSLVVSAVEEDKCGMAALAKAVSLTRGRRLQGLVLEALCMALLWLPEITPFPLAGRVAMVLTDISTTLFRCLLWTVYYHERERSHGLMGTGDGVDRGQRLIPFSRSVEYKEASHLSNPCVTIVSH
uniref:Rhomboid protease glpG n=1 Tax=Anthurium amnicola TaxID=1678845 RepID=A0A1D1YFY4_9ARAE